MQQHYRNHSRYVPFYHYVAPVLIIALLVSAIIQLAGNLSAGENPVQAFFNIGIVTVVTISWWYARAFALRAQDRVIVLEMKMRYQALTGQLLDERLRYGQIIALRFAGDDELPSLVQRAIHEKLSSKAIKQSIVNWKGDFHRV